MVAYLGMGEAGSTIVSSHAQSNLDPIPIDSLQQQMRIYTELQQVDRATRIEANKRAHNFKRELKVSNNFTDYLNYGANC